MAGTDSVNVVVRASVGTEEGIPSTEVTPHIPLEIWEQVFHHLAVCVNFNLVNRWSDPFRAALTYCALVCKDWYYLTWLHLHHYVTLRDRTDVIWLSQTLRQRPRLREIVRQVKIRGTSESDSGRGHVQHLGTFAVMLAGRLPNLETIVIEHATFTVGSVRMEDITYLATFHSVRRLAIGGTTFASISQLARLLSVLPARQNILLSSVDCAPTKHYPSTLIPFNRAQVHDLELYRVETPVMDMFIRISEACQLHTLSLTIDVKADESSAVSKIQALLNASAESLEVIRFMVHDRICPTLPMNEAAHATIEQHCNLSQHTRLRFLGLVLDWHDASALSWVAPVLSFVTSEQMRRLSIRMYFRPVLSAADMEATLTRLENHDDLVQLDEILQHERFSNILPRNVRFVVHFVDAPLKERKASLARFREEYSARFIELIRQKMPRSCQRGLVRGVTLYYSNVDVH